MNQEPHVNDARLGELLVHLARDFGLQVERSRAQRLIGQSQAAWPGTPHEHGLTWLAESAISLSLRCRVADATLEPAPATSRRRGSGRDVRRGRVVGNRICCWELPARGFGLLPQARQVRKR